MSSSVSKRRRSLAVIVALSLGAAACGAGDDAAPSLTLAPEASASGADGTTASTSEGDGTQNDEPADEAAALDVVNLFPDIDVLDIADGSTVNLAAALGGFDKPTLLWFWAPH